MKRSHPSEVDAPLSLKQICLIPQTPNYFPSDVLKYMKLNAKPRMSLKLMQICKRFKFQEFPYFVIKTIKCVWDRWIYITLDGKTIKKENLEDVPNNLWITKSVIFSISEIDYAAFMDKVVASDVEEMILGQVKVPFNLIKPLCENVKMFNSMTTHLQDDDNENGISFDELLEGLPNLENLFINLYLPSIASFDRVNQVLPPKLKRIEITNFYEDFNFGTFVDFVLQHKHIKFTIQSCQDLSLEYLIKVRMHVARIILGWDCQYLPPAINYNGQCHLGERVLAILHSRHAQTAEPLRLYEIGMN